MADLSTITGRVRASVGGLFFLAIPLVFIAVGIGTVVGSARRAATYLPATARVDKVTGGGEASDRVEVRYSFLANGRRYTGTESEDDEDTARFKELRQFKAGQELTVYYDPSDPARSQRSVKADAMGLGFVIFVLPFLVVGFNQLWQGVTGREIIRSRRPNAESDAVPGGGMFWIFIATCVAGAFGQLVFCSGLRWPWSLVSGLVILFVFIPGVNVGAYRLIRRRRSARSMKLRDIRAERQAAAGADGRTGADAGVGLDGEEVLATIDGLGKKLAICLGITVFWCGLTGVFTYFAVGSLIKHHIAKMRFASAEGVVLSSKIKVSHGDENDTVAPRIKYRYTVAGREYLGKRYDFMGGSSSDFSYAQRAVRENPPGKKVTVYYDPDDPAEAILHLEAPAISYFLLLFLQPFLLVGVFLIGWCAAMPFMNARLKRFFRSNAAPPWRIPGWGVMEQDFNGLVLRSRRNWFAPLGHFVFGYGLTCFFSIFVVGFLFHGFGDGNVDAVRWAFIVAGCVGFSALLRKLVSIGGTSLLAIDQVHKRIAVSNRGNEIETSLDKIEGLRLRDVFYSRGVRVNGRRVKSTLLEAVIEGGEPVPLHAFTRQADKPEEILAVARRTQMLLAGVIGCAVV
jgi:hypothetical protein